MDGVFPPQFPVLVSSSSLDALIYAPQVCATQTRNSSLPSFHHLRSALVAKGYVPTSMLSQDILCTPRSSLDEEKRPPLPPKDWSPNRSHLRTLSRSSRQSAGSPSRSPAGSTRRVFSIRAPRPRLPFALDLTLPGSTAANSPEPFTPPLSGSPTLCESPRSSSPERLPLLKLPTHPDYVEWDGGNKDSYFSQGWVDLNYVVYKDGLPYHPFGKENVPYILPYSKTVFKMEEHNMQLLARLLPANSPTFHDYGSRPPANVLDLAVAKATGLRMPQIYGGLLRSRLST